MAEKDLTIDRVDRVLYLVSLGVHSSIIGAAVKRSTDGESLGAMLGLIEDILDLGATISDPDE